jgi:ssDNA-binding Zn-finger/Zn-ribbon topoisomerase 1
VQVKRAKLLPGEADVPCPECGKTEHVIRQGRWLYCVDCSQLFPPEGVQSAG